MRSFITDSRIQFSNYISLIREDHRLSVNEMTENTVKLYMRIN